MRDLERRVQRLEAERSVGEEVTLEQAILWSYRLKDEPFDPETQRQYDEFCRRWDQKYGKFGRHAPESESAIASNRAGLAVAAPVEPATTAPEPAPVAPSVQGFWQRGHVYEPERNDDVLVPQPGMSLAALLAHSRKSDSR